jgi:hypothetical protein
MGRGGLYLGSYADDITATANVPPSWTLPKGCWYENTSTQKIVRWNGSIWVAGGGGSVGMTYKPATAVALTDQALSGLPTLDGVVFVAGQIALLTQQTDGRENGPWIVAPGAWSRPSYFSSGLDVSGCAWTVLAGAQFAGSIFTVTSAPGADIVGTDTLLIQRIDGEQVLTPPRIGDFTLHDPYGVATMTVQPNGSLSVNAPPNGDFTSTKWAQYVLPAPPWTVEARSILWPNPDVAYVVCAPLVLVNTTPIPTRFVAWNVQSGQTSYWDHTSEHTFSMARADVGTPDINSVILRGGFGDGFSSMRAMWWKAVHDGVNITWYESSDWRHWRSLDSRSAVDAVYGGSSPNLAAFGGQNYAEFGASVEASTSFMCDSWRVY